jgi:DNA-binding NarL/FixJ family response regulator
MAITALLAQQIRPAFPRFAIAKKGGVALRRLCDHDATVAEQTKRIRILAVDDHPVLREGLATMIGSQPDMELVAEAESGELALALFIEHRPDITLMDLRLGDMSGIEAIELIRAQDENARIIVLTTYLGDVQVLRALKAGAMGYLMKATLRRDLLETIRSVNRGQRRMAPEVSSELAQHALDDSLTAREIEVLQQIAAGCSNKVVADRLHISEDTVKGHVRSILSKLNASDRTHAVTIALRRGFLDL